MAKQLVGEVKFHVPGGQATPAPPVGTALGRFGINLGQFVQQFNDRTKEELGLRIPVVVRVYNDRSFELQTKSPAAADLLKQAATIAKGAGNPPREKVGKVTWAQIEQIVKRKMADLNARDMEHARRIIEGTARSMGLDIED
ncbi:MAG: 50S ribosomal protein L11 [Planctomycetes bacterium RBG_16_64_12]|nr:MAG: 50S ribosomal protein L11 [Planctomycetes bacterium RBG_16_64_12]